MANEAHVLLFSFPAQGHVPPMLRLAELLSLVGGEGIRVTFLNTEHSHGRFLRHSPAFERLAGSCRFRFRTIPDGLPEDDPRPFVQFLDLEESMRTQSREHYRALLRPTAGADPDGWSPVTCVVADAFARLAWEVPEEVGIPVIFFRPSSASSFWAYYSIPDLIEAGEIPFPDHGADLDEMVRGVPGMAGFLRRRDLPSFCRATSTEDRALRLCADICRNAAKGRAFVINTFEAAEPASLSSIRSVCPTTYAVGPLHLFDRGGGGSAASLWEEDKTCMTWLDAQPEKSVVYVSFGSVTVVSSEELLEFWHGLVDSGKRFLWVVRPDMVRGGTGVIPAELEKGTKERGCMVAWAPQEEVLAHPAVGSFLTHSGWNSTLESIAAGVPMLCWPFFADQQINSRLVSAMWGIGLDMKDLRERSVVQKMVREVMEGERAEEFRRATGEMAEMAKKSVARGGSSYIDLEKLVQQIKAVSS